jgi:hypothetical protein
MSGAIPPLPDYAFMAWCLVKHRNNFTFLPFTSECSQTSSVYVFPPRVRDQVSHPYKTTRKIIVLYISILNF